MQEQNAFTTLSDDHFANLKVSALSDETIQRRVYRTILNPGDLKELGFNQAQQRLVPCLYMPVYDQKGREVSGMIRPDYPRESGKNRKVRKYELKPGISVQFDFPPVEGNIEAILDVTVRLLITEGIKKADSLAQQGCATIGLTGVWNWKAKLEHGGTAEIIPGEDELPLKGRDVVIAFDSDVVTKKEVGLAMERLGSSLKRKGANVSFLYLPDLENGEKQGVDDFFYRGGTLDDLMEFVEDKVRSDKVENPSLTKELKVLVKELGLQTYKRGMPMENYDNHVKILQGFGAYNERLSYDTFTQQTLLDGEPLNSQDLHHIAMDLSDTFKFGGDKKRIREDAVEAVAKENQRDRLQDYLRRIAPWDGTPRLIFWMHEICGAEPTALNAWIGQVMIQQMVVRGLVPGSIARFVPILEGPEATGKTRLVHMLGAPWSITFDMSMDSKDAHIAIRSAWVAELAELDTLRKTSESRLKSFISQAEDTYVPKYSNLTVKYPRRTVFIGTTNDTNYLQGLTGNTRWLPVLTGHINIDLLVEWREQLFAEAIHRVDENPNLEWWEVPEGLQAQLVDQRNERRVINEYEEPLSDWLDGLYVERRDSMTGDPIEHSRRRDQVTFPEIAEGFLRIEKPEGWNRNQITMPIVNALKALGWTRKRSHGNNYWHRPTSAK